jgi:hypothetical protein
MAIADYPIPKSFLRPSSRTCEEHALFMCNKCMVKEVDRLREIMGTVANILGGPVAAMSEELRSREREERIEKGVEIIGKVMAGTE